MNGVVIALVLLIFLLVIGAVIYFSTQEEEEEKDIDDEYIPVEVITETPVVDDSEVDTFDIVNGWLYDTTYSKMIGIGEDDKLKISAYNSDNPNQRSKWTFEPTGTSFYILDQTGKALKITGSDIQLGNKSGSAKIKMVPHEDGYKLSSNSGRNWVLIEGSAIKSTKEQSKASTFLIDPSQYYIKSFETDKFKSNKYNKDTDEGKKDLIESLTNFDVKCDTGVLSGFGLVKDGSKYKYNYGCVEGDATAGDLNETTLLDTSELTNISNFHGAEAGKESTAAGFIVNCDRDGSGGGALARFKLLQGDGNKAGYEYTCRDVSTTGDDIVTLSNKVDNNHTYSENAESVEPVVNMGSLNCNQGEVLTGFKYIHDSENKVGLSGICKKLAA
jgi:hypothetical protein